MHRGRACQGFKFSPKIQNCWQRNIFKLLKIEYFQKIEIIFKILTLWAAGSATARQSFGLEYFGQASFNLLRQGRLSLDYLGTKVTNFLNFKNAQRGSKLVNLGICLATG